jgi:hypothetical protein
MPLEQLDECPPLRHRYAEFWRGTRAIAGRGRGQHPHQLDEKPFQIPAARTLHPESRGHTNSCTAQP